MLIRPRCVMEVDGREVVLRDGLPDGWRTQKGIVEVDGEIVAQRDHYPRTEYGQFPSEFVVLRDHLPAARLYGQHVIVSRLTLRAPDGTEVHLKRQIAITVVTKEQLLLGSPVVDPARGDG